MNVIFWEEKQREASQKLFLAYHDITRVSDFVPFKIISQIENPLKYWAHEGGNENTRSRQVMRCKLWSWHLYCDKCQTNAWKRMTNDRWPLSHHSISNNGQSSILSLKYCFQCIISINIRTSPSNKRQLIQYFNDRLHLYSSSELKSELNSNWCLDQLITQWPINTWTYKQTKQFNFQLIN